MEVRKMTAADVETVAALETEIFSDAWTAQGFLKSLENPNAMMLVAVEAGALAGYCCVYTVLDEAEIVNVAIHPKDRRLGFGYKLLAAMRQRFMPPEVTQYYLEVRKSNTAAQRLYEKLGFVSVGVRKNFYEKPPEDAVLMQMIVPKRDACQ